MPRISQAIAMGVGQYGAMVDISSFVKLDAGIKRSWGKKSEYDKATPGEYSFTLDNPDGRFTPDNPAILATPAREGTFVCWQAGTRLLLGRVRNIVPAFPGDEANWAQVQITIDDSLGAAARNKLKGTSLAEAAVFGASPYMYWPMDDAVGAADIAEKSGNNQLALSQYRTTFATNQLPTFATPGVPGVGSTQASFIAPSFGTAPIQQGIDLVGGPGFATDYPADSLGAWGFWFTPTASPTSFLLSWQYENPFGGSSPQFACTNLAAGMIFSGPFGTGSGPVASPALAVGEPHYFAVEILRNPTTGIATSTFYMDGVPLGAHTILSDGRLVILPRNVSRVAVSGRFFDIQHLSHTESLVNEFIPAKTDITTEAGWLTVLGQLAPTVTFDALPTDLSDAPISVVDWADSAQLDLITDLVNTEQGHIYSITSGTLLAPTEKVKVVARTRPETVAWVLDCEGELQGAPQFVRDITNMVSSITVDGAGDISVFASDSTLAKSVGSATTSEKVLNSVPTDALAWGQDRLQRGANTRMRIISVTVDAMTTPTDRSAALLAVVLGDRVRIEGLPLSPLGFTTWEGWFLGADETHSLEEHTFEMYFQPALADTAVYDTDLFMAGGLLKLDAPISAVATTMAVNTPVGGPLLEVVDVPYDLLVEDEQVRVTACTSGTPQVATIVRGVNGTAAVSHIYAGTQIEVAVPAFYAF